MILRFLQSRLALAVGLFAMTAVVLVLLRPILPIDETRYLTVAWEMWQGGSKAVPHLNGDIYSHKPPLLFWLINIVWLVTGASEFAARLVAPAFGLISILLTARLARTLWPDAPDRAGFSALILATGGVFLLFGSTTMFDTMLTTAVLAAMLALLAMRRAPGVMPTLGFGAALALGVLAKGPVILVHVIPVALMMPLWADRPTRAGLVRWYRDIGLGIAVALGLVTIWLGPALVLGGEEYRTDILWRQSAGRMVASFAHERPFWFFPALLPLFVWPWGWNRRGLAALAPRALLATMPSRFVALWAISALTGFSLISGKQVHYLLPALPAVALLLSAMQPNPAPIWRKLVLLLPVLALSGLAVAIFIGAVPQTQVNGAEMSLATLGLTIAVAIALVGVVLLIRSAVLATAIVAPVTLLVLHLALTPMIWGDFDPGAIARVLGEDQANGIATTDDKYAGEFSFAARLQQPVTVLNGPVAQAAWVKANPGGILISRNDQSDPTLTLILHRDFQGKGYRLYRVKQKAQTSPAEVAGL